MEALLKRLASTGASRGMGGSRAWAVVGIAAGTVRLLRHFGRNAKSEVVWRQAMQPGDRFEVVVSDRRKR